MSKETRYFVKQTKDGKYAVRAPAKREATSGRRKKLRLSVHAR